MFKEWVAMMIGMIIIIGIWCMFVVSMNQKPDPKTLSTIQPLDLTITYCDSCKRCTTHEALDDIIFEDAEMI